MGRAWVVLLLGVLSACGVHPRASTVSLRGDALLTSWRCEDPSQRQIVLPSGTNGAPASVAQKLLACPFNRDYQIQAMQRDKGGHVDAAILSEIVTKIRWGIDFQYRKYETYILGGNKKRTLIPRFLLRAFPEASAFLEISGDLIDEPINLGQSSSLILRQMETDRAATASAIDRRLGDFNAGKKDYLLWQAMIDLDAYFYAGTAVSALDSLNTKVTAKNKLLAAY